MRMVVSCILKSIYFILKHIVDNNLNLIIEGEENLPETGGALIVANHGSYLDIPIIARAFYHNLINLSWVVSKPNYRLWYLKPLYVIFKIIVVNGTAEKVTKGIKDKRWVVIFPEGGKRWCPPHELKKRKPRTGVAAIALTTGTNIIPVGVNGADKALSPAFFKLNRSQLIRVRIGKPFAYKRVDQAYIEKSLLKKTTKEIMDRVMGLV